MMKYQLAILSVSDPKYLRHLKTLLASVAQNFPVVKFYLHLINVEQSITEELLNIYPHIEFSWHNQQFANQENKQAYCANIRASLIFELLQQQDLSSLLYLDADSIVRKDLSELVKLIDTGDLVILERKNAAQARLRFPTGVIGIKNNSSTIKFIERWRDLLYDNLYDWYSDQACFTQTYEQMSSQVKLVSLPPEYVDWNFLPLSPIWVGKGARKYEHKIYLLEEEYYLFLPKSEQERQKQKIQLLEQQCLALHEEKRAQKAEIKKLCAAKEDPQGKLLLIKTLEAKIERFKLKNQELNEANQRLKTEIKRIKSSIVWKMSQQLGSVKQYSKLINKLLQISNKRR